MSQPDDVHEAVTEILTDADAATGAVVDAEEEPETERLLAAARRASDLLEEREPETVLAAVGLETLPDGTEPDSIPAAILEGESEAVEDLERLLGLSRLADRTDRDELDGVAEKLGRVGERSAGDSPDESADGDEGEPSDQEPSSEDEGIIEDTLRSTIGERVTEFGDEIEQVRDRLEAVTADDGEGRSDTGDGDGESSDGEGDEPTDDEREDDDLLEPDLGSESRRSPGGTARHSTMAPSPSERPDMKAVSRLSTMPDESP